MKERTKILTKECNLLVRRCKCFFRGGTAMAISSKARSIPTVPVAFTFGGHKTTEHLPKGMGLPPREMHMPTKI